MSEINKVIEFFELKDKRLAEIISKINFDDWFEVEVDESKYFYDLCRTIVGQQLAGKAASAIFGRFEGLLGEVKPSRILEMEPQSLRDVGLSWAKVRSVSDLAERVLNGKLVLSDLSNLDNESLIEELSKVKGIGRWTAEMFLMFRLGREDIFSLGDLGLKNGLKKYLALEDVSRERMSEITDSWSPYRTYGAIAMWHLLDNR